MSLEAACGSTMLRSVAVALLTIPVCWYLRDELARLGRRSRLVLWTLLLLPFLTPGLLTGYAYANFSLSLVLHPRWNELLYAVLIAAKLLAVGTAVLSFSPPAPTSREAMHCARLANDPSWSCWRRISFMAPFWLRGPLRAAFPAFGVIFLLVFQEFEMASLMGTTSWTVWMFDKQAKGLMLRESLRLSTIPAACELLILAFIVACSLRTQLLLATPVPTPCTAPVRLRIGLWLLATGACIAVFGIPIALVGRDTLSGLAMMIRNRALVREIGVAVGFGAASGVIASLLAGGILKASSGQNTSVVARSIAGLAAIAVLPGLLGSLIISLAVLALFQTSPLRAAYNTPAPALVALVAFLVPRAALVQMMLHAARPRHGLHLTRLLQSSDDGSHQRAGRQLEWVMHRRGQFLAACMICLWGYWELTPVAILAPPGMTSAPVRLYNFMHYGHNEVLSAMTLTAMLAPVVLIGFALAVHWLAVRVRLVQRD